MAKSDYRDYGLVADEAVKIALPLIKMYNFKTMSDTGELYYYNKEKGVFQRGGENRIAEYKELSYQKAKRQKVIDYIKIKTRTDREAFDKNENAINCKNGLLNIYYRTHYLHTSDYLSVVQWPITFDASAKCEKIEEFLRQQLVGENHNIVKKMFGYLLLNNCKYQVFFVIVGPPNTGKSVLIELLNAFIGERNLSHLTVQQITNEKFNRHELYGKIANTFTDLPSEKVLDSAILNALVSGEYTKADRKYGSGVTFRNRAKLIFSTNIIPFDKSKNPALEKRLLKIEMNNVIPKEEQDLELVKKLTTEKELSGLLNFALDGLVLLEKEGFPRRNYNKIESSPLHNFIKNKCKLDYNAEIETEILYSAFQEYINAENKMKIEQNLQVPQGMSKEAFGKELSAVGIEKRQAYLQGERYYVYQGITLVTLDFSYPLSEEKKVEKRYEEIPSNPSGLCCPSLPFLYNSIQEKNTMDGTSWRTWYPYLIARRS